MGIRFITFAGGEPTLRYDVLKIAKKYFSFIAFFTNGQIKIPKEFKSRIYLSLDGLKDENNKIRGKGSFEKAIKNYYGDKRVIIVSVLSSVNYSGQKKLREFINLAKKMNVRGIFFVPYVPVINEKKSISLTAKQLIEIKNELLKELDKKDTILAMTKDIIEFMSKPIRSIKKCGCSQMSNYIFNTKNKKKRCPYPAGDCSKCIAQYSYWTPMYKFKNWISYQLMLYKYFL